jgi:hypothetical protein
MRTRKLTVLALSLTTAVGACAAGASGPEAPAPARTAAGADPRVGLRGGWLDAESAARNLVHLAHRPPSEGFFNPRDPGDFAFAHSDLAFQGNLVFQGSYHGVQVWDISDPRNPRLRAKLVCPGGQGDVSVYGNLLFVSVEEPRGRVDCGTQGVAQQVSPERFMGVRIFDITDLDNPRQVAAIQTCRGSHTHTLVTEPNDSDHIYVYVQGISRVRPAEELPGCSGLPPEQDPNTSYFRIEVIRVPLAAPERAEIVNEPRIFADAATGTIAGLWPGGDHGPGTQRTERTDQCHDITAYPAIGLAAGACSGNGILLDIRDPANPKRISEVIDPNFAYWHSATFNNDGTKVVFTDEWGGGVAPRCRATDRPEWGANAIFRLENGRLAERPAGYFKVPAPQSDVENCVAHNGSLIPVPGRDIMVQAWYQGGVSVFDFTDPANPVEIAFFDRGPVNPDRLTLGGYWSAYWYNGVIVGSEIGRGLDIFELVPSEHLTQNEIEAAKLVRFDEFNPQLQPRIEWPASFVVARAYVDQLERGRGLSADRIAAVRGALDRAEREGGEQRRATLTALAAELERDAAGSRDAARVRALTAVVRDLAGSGAED